MLNDSFLPVEPLRPSSMPVSHGVPRNHSVGAYHSDSSVFDEIVAPSSQGPVSSPLRRSSRSTVGVVSHRRPGGGSSSPTAGVGREARRREHPHGRRPRRRRRLVGRRRSPHRRPATSDERKRGAESRSTHRSLPGWMIDCAARCCEKTRRRLIATGCIDLKPESHRQQCCSRCARGAKKRPGSCEARP